MSECAAKREMAETRAPLRAFRRRLPLGRAAVLLVDARHHIVGVADVSTTGAFVITRTQLPIGQRCLLRLRTLTDRPELQLEARVVRTVQAVDESPNHPKGVAVQFASLDRDTRELLEEFVHRIPKRK